MKNHLTRDQSSTASTRRDQLPVFRPKTNGRRPTTASGGFTLLELLVAMTIFLVIAGCAFTLFNKQMSSSMSLRGQVGLNLSLRNAASQLEMDLVNAGENYVQTPSMVYLPSAPLGVVIVNNWVNPGSSCYSAGVYGASCFDQINIIPPANPTTYPVTNTTDGTGGSLASNCSNTDTGVAYAQAATLSGFSLAQTAAEYSAGDQLLFYSGSGKAVSYTSVVLTAAPTVAGAAVKFVFNPTNGGINTSSNDPLGITTCPGIQAGQACTIPLVGKSVVGNSFCGNDYVVKLAPIIYQVDYSNPADPRLMRTQAGTTAVLMDQVIGFKVGATIWNSLPCTANPGTACTDVTAAGNVPEYFYQASQYTNTSAGDEAWNYTMVRSLRISLIGRTAPGTMPYSFKNSFDQGAYTVQGISVVVNPRNMSMNNY